MDPGTIIAVIQLSSKALVQTYKYVRAVKDANTEIDRLRVALEELQSAFKALERLAKNGKSTALMTSKSLVETTKQAYLDLEALLKILNPSKPSRLANFTGFRALEWPFKKDELEKYLARLEKYKSTVTFTLQIDQTSSLQKIEDQVENLSISYDHAEVDRQLAKLIVAHGARFDSPEQEQKPYCVAGTRVDVLKQIEEWSQCCRQPIYWLSGVAGSGKSTISRSLCRRLRDEGSLAASFFFVRGGGDLSVARKFVTTVAHQLSNLRPILKNYYYKLLKEDGDILFQGLSNQWNQMIQRPLTEYADKFPSGQKLVFVIDALDECENDEDIQLLLDLIFSLQRPKNLNVGLFVTSRPEIVIRSRISTFEDVLHRDLNLGDVPQVIAERDIQKVVQLELDTIAQQRKIHNWPAAQDVLGLVKKCDHLFIYASTAIKFVADPADSPVERLSILIEKSSDDFMNLPELDMMYARVLEYSILNGRQETSKRRLIERFHRIVAPFLLLEDTLSVSALSCLLDVGSEDIKLSFACLQSLIYLPNHMESPIRSLHPSFREYLEDTDRCRSSPFKLNVKIIHQSLAAACIRIVISSSLCKDVCDIRFPGTPIDQIDQEKVDLCLPNHVQYACMYWVEHLEKATTDERVSPDLQGYDALYEFLQNHFLFWLEAMTLLRRIKESVEMMIKLEKMLQIHPNAALKNLMTSAKRFTISNANIIQQYPLQIYISALLFAPLDCGIRRCYAQLYPPWVLMCSNSQQNSNLTTKVLEPSGHSLSVLTFSPDQKTVAAAFTDKELLQIWDVATGALLITIDTAGNENARAQSNIALMFLPECSTKMLTGSIDFLRLWSCRTGALLESHKLPENGGGSRVGDLAISTDCRYLAQLSDAGSTVRIYDREVGRVNMELKCSAYVFSIIFGSFGRSECLVTVSSNGISLWNVKTGERTKNLAIGPSHILMTVLFNRSGTQLVLNNQLRDLETNTSRFFDQQKRIARTYAGAISGDDEWLILGYDDAHVRVWNMQSQELVQVLRGHSQPITKVAISEDSQTIATGSFDRTIRLWDTNSFSPMELDSGVDGKHRILNLYFSPDGTELATISQNSTVELWDPATGAPFFAVADQGLEKQSTWFGYSPDGKYLFLATWNKLTLMDSESRRPIFSHEEKYLSRASHVQFSPCSTWLLAMNANNELDFWNVATGDLSMAIQMQKENTRQPMAISPTSRYLALNEVESICVVDLENRGPDVILMFDQLSSLSFFGFSQDGKKLVAVSEREVFLWDSQVDGPPQLRIEDPHLEWFPWISAPVLSPNEHMLAIPTPTEVILYDIERKGFVGRFGFPRVQDAEFIDGGRTLKTECGSIQLQAETQLDAEHSDNSEHRTSDSLESWAEAGWTYANHWFRFDGVNMVWLPPDLRERVKCHGNVFAVAHSAADVRFIEFDTTGPWTDASDTNRPLKLGCD